MPNIQNPIVNDWTIYLINDIFTGENNSQNKTYKLLSLLTVIMFSECRGHLI